MVLLFSFHFWFYRSHHNNHQKGSNKNSGNHAESSGDETDEKDQDEEQDQEDFDDEQEDPKDYCKGRDRLPGTAQWCQRSLFQVWWLSLIDFTFTWDIQSWELSGLNLNSSFSISKCSQFLLIWACFVLLNKLFRSFRFCVCKFFLIPV